MNSKWRKSLIAIVILLPVAGALAADREKVSPALAKLLNQARAHLQAGRNDKVIALLGDLKDADHSSRRLMLGYAYEKLSDPDRATLQYKAALQLAPNLSPAGLALAQIYASKEQWSAAAKLLGQHANIEICSKNVLLLYAQVAGEMKDKRLSAILAAKGITRFPSDKSFKRLDLQSLLDGGRYKSARQSVLGLLAGEPTNPELWRQLAFVQQRCDDDVRKLSAVEAALLCDPTNMSSHRQFLAGQIGLGNFHTVIQHGAELLSGPIGKRVVSDISILGLLIHAADMNRSDKILATWLSLVGESKHTRAMKLAAARLALRKDDMPRARTILTGLIASGDTDPSVYLWAGHLAERTEDSDRAIVLYAQARKLTGPAADMATLYLARLHLSAKRREQAARLLVEYLKSHPQDTYARAMLALTGPDPI